MVKKRRGNFEVRGKICEISEKYYKNLKILEHETPKPMTSQKSDDFISLELLT